MGIFDIFKKKKVEEETKEISLEEAKSLLQKRSVDAEKELETLGTEIERKLARFTQTLTEKTVHLQNITLEDKKEDERLKRLTMQGLQAYNEQLTKLTKKIEEINTKRPVYQTIQTIDEALATFSKQSIKKYHRATILIGKELADINTTIQNFHKELHETAKENEQHILETTGINKLEKHETNIQTIKTAKEAIQNIIEELREQHEETKKKKEQEEKKLAEEKEQGTYKQLQKEKEETKKQLEKTKKQILTTAQNLDLKTISKRVHGYTKHQNIVAKYRENFHQALTEDENNEFIEILNEKEQGLVKEALQTLREQTLTLQKKESDINPEITIKPIQENIQEQKTNAEELLQQITIEERKKQKHEEEQEEEKRNMKQLLETILQNVKITE